LVGKGSFKVVNELLEIGSGSLGLKLAAFGYIWNGDTTVNSRGHGSSVVSFLLLSEEGKVFETFVLGVEKLDNNGLLVFNGLWKSWLVLGKHCRDFFPLFVASCENGG